MRLSPVRLRAMFAGLRKKFMGPVTPMKLVRVTRASYPKGARRLKVTSTDAATMRRFKVQAFAANKVKTVDKSGRYKGTGLFMAVVMPSKGSKYRRLDILAHELGHTLEFANRTVGKRLVMPKRLNITPHLKKAGLEFHTNLQADKLLKKAGATKLYRAISQVKLFRGAVWPYLRKHGRAVAKKARK